MVFLVVKAVCERCNTMLLLTSTFFFFFFFFSSLVFFFFFLCLFLCVVPKICLCVCSLFSSIFVLLLISHLSSLFSLLISYSSSLFSVQAQNTRFSIQKGRSAVSCGPHPPNAQEPHHGQRTRRSHRCRLHCRHSRVSDCRSARARRKRLQGPQGQAHHPSPLAVGHSRRRRARHPHQGHNCRRRSLAPHPQVTDRQGQGGWREGFQDLREQKKKKKKKKNWKKNEKLCGEVFFFKCSTDRSKNHAPRAIPLW